MSQGAGSCLHVLSLPGTTPMLERAVLSPRATRGGVSQPVLLPGGMPQLHPPQAL